VLAVRSVHVKLLREVFALLGSASIKRELAGLNEALREPGLKLGVRKVYAEGFDRLRAVVRHVVVQVAEIDAMLGSAFRKLNTEHGFSLQVPPAPDLHRLERDLAAVEQSHVQYLGVGNLIHLVRAEFTDKLIRSLFARVRAIFETAVGEIELWNKAASGQLDVELRERRRAFSRRIEAIQRIQDAASGLDTGWRSWTSSCRPCRPASSSWGTGCASCGVGGADPRRLAGRDRPRVSTPAPEHGDFAALIVAWQRRHGRHDLPWQGTRDPYRVWLSEIMLQQTQVATVLAYYPRFVQRFGDVAALAQASEDEVLALWSGLGYYRRARLHRCAQRVMADFGGRFPTQAVLATLPGIGRSTAAAIAAFCFGERSAILDGNVKRVLARVFAIGDDLAQATAVRALWERAEALLPTTRLHSRMPAYTQGLMDLGATVCLPRQPQCGHCPVAGLCRAHAQGQPQDYPVKTRKAAPRPVVPLWLVHAVDGRGASGWSVGRRAASGPACTACRRSRPARRPWRACPRPRALRWWSTHPSPTC
jgi:A/G-specific adenine glycosylase